MSLWGAINRFTRERFYPYANAVVKTDLRGLTMSTSNDYVTRLQTIANRILVPRRMSREEASSLVEKIEQAADCVIKLERRKNQCSTAKNTL